MYKIYKILAVGLFGVSPVLYKMKKHETGDSRKTAFLKATYFISHMNVQFFRSCGVIIAMSRHIPGGASQVLSINLVISPGRCDCYDQVSEDGVSPNKW